MPLGIGNNRPDDVDMQFRELHREATSLLNS
jgi:hypothetical protein